MNTHHIFRSNMKRRRTKLGWTQQRLAEELGISRPRVTEIENGRFVPTLALIERVAGVLGVRVTTLLKENSAEPLDAA